MSLTEFVQVSNELRKQQEYIKYLQEKTLHDNGVISQQIQQAKIQMLQIAEVAANLSK